MQFTLLGYYYEIVGSLKPFVSHKMLGPKCFYCLNQVLKAFVGDSSVPALNDSIEVIINICSFFQHVLHQFFVKVNYLYFVHSANKKVLIVDSNVYLLF